MLKCPKCGADKFRSNLGFQNHCRLHCKLLFSSTEERIQKCGMDVDPSEVPESVFSMHPTQFERYLELARLSSQVGPEVAMERTPAHVASSDLFDGEGSDTVDYSHLNL